MAFKQGEVIELDGIKVVYIKMNRTRYVAADLADPTKSYTCKGGKSTGQFRQDVLNTYFEHQKQIEIKKAVKQAEAGVHKALPVGQGVNLKHGIGFILKHKRTKFLSMDLKGQVWDSHYGAIQSVSPRTVGSVDNEEFQRLFNLRKD